MSWLDEKKKEIEKKERDELEKQRKIEEERIKHEKFQAKLKENEASYKDKIADLYRNVNLVFDKEYWRFLNNIHRTLKLYYPRKQALSDHSDNTHFAEQIIKQYLCNSKRISSYHIFDKIFLLFSIARMQIPVRNDVDSLDSRSLRIEYKIKHLLTFSNQIFSNWYIKSAEIKSYFRYNSKYINRIENFNNLINKESNISTKPIGKVHPYYVSRMETSSYDIIFGKIINDNEILEINGYHDSIFKKHVNHLIRNCIYKEDLKSSRQEAYKNGLFQFNKDLEEQEDIKASYNLEKKLYNDRINKMRNMSLSQLEMELQPYYNLLHYDLYQILTDSRSSAPKITAQLISSFIVLKSLSLVKGYNNDKNADFVKGVKLYNSHASNMYVRSNSYRNMSYDHIWIDGVGWMHEDEVGHDR
jgi:hypothetical protein